MQEESSSSRSVIDIRNETVRNRMIENGRDEDACRQMDVLTDEDHTHHLTPQEFYHYKSNWWLRSNKTGSNIVAVECRCKQALSTLQQLEEEGSKLSTMGTVLLHLPGGVGKVHGGLLIPVKVTIGMHQVLTQQGDLLFKFFGNNSSGHDSLEFNYFVTDGSLTTDGGPL